MAQPSFSIDDILDLLNRRRIRATYGAIGELLGIPAQSVGSHLGPRTPRASWVVNKATRHPSKYLPTQIHPDLQKHDFVISTAVELIDMLTKPPVSRPKHHQRKAAGSETGTTLVGIDLAWNTRTRGSGIAVGTLVDKALSVTDLSYDVVGIDAVLSRIPADAVGVAIDAPLVIRNSESSRPCEKALSRVYSRMGAGCHPSNTTRFPNAASVEISDRLEARGHRHFGKHRWQIEVYPHPALIEVFGLDYRLAYKKGDVSARRFGQIRLAMLIKSLARRSSLKLRLPHKLRHHVSSEWIGGLLGERLKANEDALDALICLYIAGLYAIGETMQVFGDKDSGYIVVPTRATLPANREPGSRCCR